MDILKITKACGHTVQHEFIDKYQDNEVARVKSQECISCIRYFIKHRRRRPL